jgi:hypothetical protein
MATADISTVQKGPTEILDYIFDWKAWLGSDTIASATVTADTGLTVVSTTYSTTSVTTWISGGTVDTDYVVTCTIVTATRTATCKITFQIR